MAKTISKGDLVDIEFLDHAENSDHVLRFNLCGEVEQVTNDAYIIRTWRYSDPVDRAKDENTKENENKYAIVKKAVIGIYHLKRNPH